MSKYESEKEKSSRQMALPRVTLLDMRELREKAHRKWNWTTGTAGRASGVRKTYKKVVDVKTENCENLNEK